MYDCTFFPTIPPARRGGGRQEGTCTSRFVVLAHQVGLPGRPTRYYVQIQLQLSSMLHVVVKRDRSTRSTSIMHAGTGTLAPTRYLRIPAYLLPGRYQAGTRYKYYSLVHHNLYLMENQLLSPSSTSSFFVISHQIWS